MLSELIAGLENFQQEWDNANGAIYDAWREHCKRDARSGILPDAAANHDTAQITMPRPNPSDITVSSVL